MNADLRTVKPGLLSFFAYPPEHPRNLGSRAGSECHKAGCMMANSLTRTKDKGVTCTTGSNPNPYTFTGLSASIPYKIRVKDSFGCNSPSIP